MNVIFINFINMKKNFPKNKKIIFQKIKKNFSKKIFQKKNFSKKKKNFFQKKI